MDTIIARPEEGTYPHYYPNYYKWVDFNQPMLELWQYAIQDSLEFWNGINAEEAEFRYEEGKWSIKEMLLHICDTERIFIFRALSISRGEQADLPGFDHNAYVPASGAEQRDWLSILQEYQHIKQMSYDFIASLSAEQWSAKGRMAGQEIALSAIAYVIPGHDKHHQEIVKNRYLSKIRNS